jgi:hypothetical protein
MDCKWMNAHFEAYCCNRLSPHDEGIADSHIQSCEACQEELRGLNAIDPMIKELFRQRLAAASARRTAPSRRFVPAAAGAALAAAAIALVLLFNPGSETPDPQAVPAQAQSAQQTVPKDDGPAAIDRAKPDEAGAPLSSAAATGTNSNAAAEAFAVIDPAGYVRRLEDYRGYVLVFGVWSPDQPQAAANLEEIYRTFARDTRFRLIGVSSRREPAPDVIFPVVYNSDSRLLGARESEFVVIDAGGAERLRGSLLTDAADTIRSVRTVLEN